MRTGADRSHAAPAVASVTADVIGRTDERVRCRLRDDVAARLGTVGVGDVLLVASSYEVVRGVVIGLPAPGVVELRLDAEIDRTATVEIKRVAL